MYPQGSIITSYIMNLSVLVRRTGNRMYGKALDLSATEYPILAMLVREGELTVGHICERLDRDKGHVSRDIAALTKRGILKKIRATQDARQIVVQFSPEATAERATVAAIMQERSEKFTEGLTAKDIETLKRLLMIVIRNAQGLRRDS